MIRTIAAAMLAGLVGAGCDAPTWHAESPKYYGEYHAGHVDEAAALALHCAHKGVEPDQLLFNLDAGAIIRADNDLGESTARFDDADTLVGNYQDWPDVRISEEFAAALTSARTTAYRGTLSDLVMLNTYRALNHMEQGHVHGARAMLIKSQFVQQDIAQKYAADLAKAQDETDSQKKDASSSADTDKTVSEGEKQNADAYKDLLNLRPYADYVNPFCDYVQGIFFGAAALDQSDRERSAVAFKRAASMEPANAFIKQDIAAAERFANGGKWAPTTYVIFETGKAPSKGQVKATLPMFLVNRQAPTVSLFFPTMEVHPEFVQFLDVTAGGQPMRTELVSDMDSVVLREFKDSLQQVITRMIISACTKAAIDAGIRQGIKGQNGYVQLGYSAVSFVYQAATNEADLRSWNALPKQFQVARFPTPDDGVVTLAGGGGGGGRIAVEPGKTNVIYAKSIARGVPMVVRHFIITPEGTPETYKPAPAVASKD